MMPRNNEEKHSAFDFFNLLYRAVIFVILINIIISLFTNNRNANIQYNQFLSLVESGNVSAVEIDQTNKELSIVLKENFDRNVIYDIFQIEPTDTRLRTLYGKEKIYYTGAIPDPDLKTFLYDYQVNFGAKKTNPVLGFVLSWILPIIVFWSILNFYTNKIVNANKSRMRSMMNFGNASAKIYNIYNKSPFRFSDVAGLEDAKESLSEIVDFLHHSEKYLRIGAKLPKGALLVGPPGTGKTLLAKAVAGEARVPFFSLSGSEFVEMFVGVGAKRVRDLFAQATKKAPCIIFIDEIDAIGKRREDHVNSNDEREQTLNQLLAEMDGFDTSKGIIILAATNRPEVLDKALLRPGRFDRRILVDKPDLKERIAILHVHSATLRLEPSVDLKQIALATSGASGADLANILNEAALRAVRQDRTRVGQPDLMEAVENIIAGKEKKNQILSQPEKRLVAYHEIGHALAVALQKHTQPIQKITIVPRTMGTLGYTLQMPEEEKYVYTREELTTEITTLLAGRAAEELIFNTQSTGAVNDIERATLLARKMVTQYGMSQGFDLMGLESVQNPFLDGKPVPLHAQSTGAEIDKEVLMIIEDCHKNALSLLKKHLEQLHPLAKELMEYETITGERFMEILKDSIANETK